MSDLPITLTCADYARVMPLASGGIKVEGIALTLILGSGALKSSSASATVCSVFF